MDHAWANRPGHPPTTSSGPSAQPHKWLPAHWSGSVGTALPHSKALPRRRPQLMPAAPLQKIPPWQAGVQRQEADGSEMPPTMHTTAKQSTPNSGGHFYSQQRPGGCQMLIPDKTRNARSRSHQGKPRKGTEDPRPAQAPGCTGIGGGDTNKAGAASPPPGWGEGSGRSTYIASETSRLRSLAGAGCRDCDPPILAAPWRAG